MSTATNPALPAYFNTDADFQNWGRGINTLLAATGLVQVSSGVEAGQVNWSTVATPNTSNQVKGYEIWRFDDTMQGTVPVFIKLEYGSGDNQQRPQLYFTVAVGGSNGSGSLTGQVGTRQQLACVGNKSAGVNLPAYVFSDSGEGMTLCVNLDVTNNNFGLFGMVERTKDNTGASTTDGIVYFTTNSNTGQTHLQFISATGGFPGDYVSNVPAAHPGFFGRSGSGSVGAVSPLFLPLGGKWLYMTNLIILNPGDWPAGGTISMQIWGGTHTYMSLDKTCIGTTNWVNGSQGGFAMRWE